MHLPGTRRDAGQYFVNYVTDQLIATYGAGRVFGGGLKVTSTIDLDLQETAHKAIESVLKKPGGPAAALVAIDPRTGAVKAMVGGSNFRESQFNLATQAERQPGSSFKPIVLATALRQGISPVTSLDSKPVDIDAGDRIWHVTNYEGDYLGRIDLKKAMVVSDNAVYAQLTKLVGPKAIVETAHKLGIHSQLDPYFSIGLGAVAVNPLDMARAYATFANRGVRIDGSLTQDRPRVVEQVEFARTGAVTKNKPVGKAAMTTGEADLLTSILQGVVTQGTGKRAALTDRPTAGKTGTTDNYGDAWFVGYTPQLAVAVWVGYPDKLKPMLTEFNGEPVAGGTLPTQIWHAFMTAADKQLKLAPEQFPSDAVHPGPGQADRLARRVVQARQRLLPRHARRRVLRRSRPVDAGQVLRERGLGAARRRPDGRHGQRAARATAARERADRRSHQGRQASGLRRQAGAPQRVSVGQRLGAALRDPTGPALRAAAEPRRVERDRGPVAAEDARGPHQGHLRQGADGIGARADAGARGRRRQGPQGDAGRGPRDSQRESLIT